MTRLASCAACLALLFALGCHRSQGIRGYVLESDGPMGKATVRDAQEDEVAPVPCGRPIAGAIVRVEVKGRAEGWVPIGPYAARSETRTDGLGRFDLAWYELPHPQDARLCVEKEGYEPLTYEFILPCLQEVRMYLAREVRREGR